MELIHTFKISPVYGIAINSEDTVFISHQHRQSIDTISLVDGKYTLKEGQIMYNLGNYCYLYGIAFDKHEVLYIGVTEKIFKMTKEGLVTYVAKQDTKIKYPGHLWIDENGITYYCDRNFIGKISKWGKVSVLCGNGTEGDVDGKGTDARLNASSIAYNQSKQLFYFTDTESNKIKTMTKDGTVTTLCTCDKPLYVTLDKSGNLYVASESGIKVMNENGELIKCLENTGIGYCSGLAFNSKGDLFVLLRKGEVYVLKSEYLK